MTVSFAITAGNKVGEKPVVFDSDFGTTGGYETQDTDLQYQQSTFGEKVGDGFSGTDWTGGNLSGANSRSTGNLFIIDNSYTDAKDNSTIMGTVSDPGGLTAGSGSADGLIDYPNDHAPGGTVQLLFSDSDGAAVQLSKFGFDWADSDAGEAYELQFYLNHSDVTPFHTVGFEEFGDDGNPGVTGAHEVPEMTQGRPATRHHRSDPEANPVVILVESSLPRLLLLGSDRPTWWGESPTSWRPALAGPPASLAQGALVAPGCSRLSR